MEPNLPVNNQKETARLEIFSDGVFAIAITLLVLELIQVLHIKSGEGLMETCLHHWQSFLAFGIGFVTILICWINHHIAFEYISKTDTTFMWVNGFLLFVVTLTPFPTAILAEYLESESVMALAVFGFNYILISLAADGICSNAYNRNLVPVELREEFSSYKLIYRYALIYTIIVFFLCFVSITLSIILYVILFAAFASPKKLSASIQKFRMRRIKVRSMTK